MTSQTAREFDVEVWGQACRVAVFQKSESVWVAVGDYKGKRIEVKDRSQAMALAHWRNTAQDRGT